jgi:DNA-directed RNA polymerase subunit RPC12/RpoP
MIRMAIQVVFIDEANDRRDVHEIVGIDRGQLCPAVLGLSLAEAKKITGGIQQVLTSVQVAEWQADQRACPDCGNRRLLKGHHPIVFRTPFGKLRLDSERVRVCPCVQRPTISVSPLADLLSERVSPEMLFLETKFASLVSYGLTVRCWTNSCRSTGRLAPSGSGDIFSGSPKRTKPSLHRRRRA